MDSNCCSDEIAIELENTECEENKCCSHEDKHEAEDQSADTNNLPQHAQAHQCSSCAITFIINLPIIIDRLDDHFSYTVNTEVKELLSRYSFSIWIPPNSVV